MAVAFPLSLALIVLTRNHLPAKPCLPLRGSTLFVELHAHTCRRRWRVARGFSLPGAAKRAVRRAGGADGIAAQELALHQHYDLVILDRALPGATGMAAH